MTRPEELARSEDPETSHEAAAWLIESGALGRGQKTAYVGICSAPGCVAGELELITHYPGIWKRVNELHKKKLIYYGEKRTFWGTGRPQRSIWPVKNPQRPMPL